MSIFASGCSRAIWLKLPSRCRKSFCMSTMIKADFRMSGPVLAVTILCLPRSLSVRRCRSPQIFGSYLHGMVPNDGKAGGVFLDGEPKGGMRRTKLYGDMEMPYSPPRIQPGWYRAVRKESHDARGSATRLDRSRTHIDDRSRIRSAQSN